MKTFCVMLLLLASSLRASVKPYLVDGVALQDYDAVSYFIDGKATKGSSAFSYKDEDATYLFSSAEHLKLFKADPKKYEPAYGGWCAYAMSKGNLVEVNPERFKILKGKLLLFYDAYWNNTLKTWNADESELFPLAEASWKRLNAPPAPSK
jgi:YHS domain-containing protein